MSALLGWLDSNYHTKEYRYEIHLIECSLQVEQGVALLMYIRLTQVKAGWLYLLPPDLLYIPEPEINCLANVTQENMHLVLTLYAVIIPLGFSGSCQSKSTQNMLLLVIAKLCGATGTKTIKLSHINNFCNIST